MQSKTLKFSNQESAVAAPVPPPQEDEYRDAAWGIQNWGEDFSPLFINIPKPTGHLVQIEGVFSGICHTDVHLALNDLGGSMYPIVPGHELVGRVIAVGDQVTKFKVGDYAGVAALTDSCLECDSCHVGEEQYCEKGWQSTYNHKKKYNSYGGNKDTQTFGGYTASYCHHERFLVKMPNEMDYAKAAPLLCAGITLYDPLKSYGCVNSEKPKTVGIIGIGGLGTMGIKLAKAMGHKVVALSTNPAKEELAKQKGADVFILTSDPEQMAANASTCDLILNTISAHHDVRPFVGILKSRGTIVQLGLLGEMSFDQIPLILGKKSIAGSLIGGIQTTEECIEFCKQHDIYPDIQVVNADQINWVYEQLQKSNSDGVRYVIDITKSKENQEFMPKE